MATHAYASSRGHVRARGKHRDPRSTYQVRQVVAAGGLTAGAFMAAELAMPGMAAAATADDFAKLRVCESGGNYSINTGNGYYGAYQFSLGTWRGLGYSGYPHQASPATQDQAARELQARSGWGQWPACSAKLGLYGSSGGSSTPARTFTTATTSAPVLVQPGAVTTTGTVLSRDSHAKTYRSDVAALQRELRDRGYHIKVDGYFGPKTESSVLAFQAIKDLTVDGLVGPETQEALAS